MNLDIYISYKCILTYYFRCFTCVSISIVFELFTPCKCRTRVLDKVQTADLL